MTTLIPAHQSHDYKHMYNIRDLRSNKVPTSGVPNSIYGIIASNPDFTYYRRIVILAGMENILSSTEFKGTVFVPSDTFLEDSYANQIITNMDTATAKAYIKYSFLPVKTSEKSLTDIPFYKLKTQNSNSALIDVKNINKTCILNDTVNVVKFDLTTNNGVIHVIDRMLFPIAIV